MIRNGVVSVGLVVILGVLGAACSAEPDGTIETGTDTGDSDQATTKGGAGAADPAAALLGSWQLVKNGEDRTNCESGRAVVVRGTNAADDATNGPRGPWVKLLCADSEFEFDHYTTFMGIGEGERCDSMNAGGGEFLRVCHKTWFEGGVLVHRITASSTKYFVVPSGTSVSEFRLSVENGSLRFVDSVDGENFVSHRFTR